MFWAVVLITWGLAAVIQIPLKYNLVSTEIPVPNKQIEDFKTILGFTRSAYCLQDLDVWKCATCDQNLNVSNITLVGEFHAHAFG